MSGLGEKSKKNRDWLFFSKLWWNWFEAAGKFNFFLKISHIGRSLALLSQNFAKMGTFGLFGLFLHFWGSKIHFPTTPDRGGVRGTPDRGGVRKMRDVDEICSNYLQLFSPLGGTLTGGGLGVPLTGGVLGYTLTGGGVSALSVHLNIFGSAALSAGIAASAGGPAAYESTAGQRGPLLKIG